MDLSNLLFDPLEQVLTLRCGTDQTAMNTFVLLAEYIKLLS